MLIELERFGYTPDGTFGRITIGDLTLWTCERPWLANRVGESCIPEGVYELRLRESPLITRLTDGDHSHGWEVCNVPGRTDILIHQANWPRELKGCIAPGFRWGVVGREIGVASSRLAFDRLMLAIPNEENEIWVRQYRPEYP